MIVCYRRFLYFWQNYYCFLLQGSCWAEIPSELQIGSFFDQFQNKIIIGSDFNVRHRSGRGSKNYPIGNSLLEDPLDSNLVCVSSGNPTFCKLVNIDSDSCIDLTFSNPCMNMDLMINKCRYV